MGLRVVFGLLQRFIINSTGAMTFERRFRNSFDLKVSLRTAVVGFMTYSINYGALWVFFKVSWQLPPFRSSTLPVHIGVVCYRIERLILTGGNATTRGACSVNFWFFVLQSHKALPFTGSISCHGARLGCTAFVLGERQIHSRLAVVSSCETGSGFCSLVSSKFVCTLLASTGV